MPRNLCQIIVLLLTVQPLSAATTGRSIVAYPEHSGFSEVAAPVGTSPSADGPESTLTITSSGPITVTGDSAADTLDFSVTPHTDISGLPTTYLRLDAGNGPVTGPLTISTSDSSSSSLDVEYPSSRSGDVIRVYDDLGTPMLGVGTDSSLRLGAETCSGNCSESVTIKHVNAGFGELQITDPAGASTTVRANEYTLPASGNGKIILRAWADPPSILFSTTYGQPNAGRVCWGQLDACLQYDLSASHTVCVGDSAPDCVDDTPVQGRLIAQNASGTNVSGGDLALAGGRGTGSGDGGSVIFEASLPGSSGSTQNSWAVVAEAAHTGFRIDNLGDSTRPACGAATEFTLWPTRGAPGAASQIEVCLKSAADTYGWVVLVTG